MVDDDFIARILRDAGSRHAGGAPERQENVSQVWQAIEVDLRSGGPFAALLRSFREAAREAATELIFADAADVARIRSLQNEIRRSIQTMEVVAAFKDRAADLDEQLSENESPFIPLNEE